MPDAGRKAAVGPPGTEKAAAMSAGPAVPWRTAVNAAPNPFAGTMLPTVSGPFAGTARPIVTVPTGRVNSVRAAPPAR